MTLRIRLLIGQNMGLNDCNHALVGLSFRDRFARRDDWRPSTLVSSSFRRPVTEVGSKLYVLTDMLSTATRTLFSL
jgi:hypothetical protein